MKVLLDTNIILDYALERPPFWQVSEQIFLLLEQFQGYVSASTFSDLYYIIRKQRGHNWTLTFLNRLVSVCQIALVDQTVILMALTVNFRDFEDAIQYSTAVINHLDAIVTRNAQDFAEAALPIMTPDSLIQEITHSA
ncbi:MAG: PIN domain-containing protein [Timaviella obliquedivisa GSE-PSE-MK23-08B]|nr:PIN domain-containing protein [Timaviella obliquedivisa GSE-PSE-MK23-08B]